MYELQFSVNRAVTGDVLKAINAKIVYGLKNIVISKKVNFQPNMTFDRIVKKLKDFGLTRAVIYSDLKEKGLKYEELVYVTCNERFADESKRLFHTHDIVGEYQAKGSHLILSKEYKIRKFTDRLLNHGDATVIRRSILRELHVC